MECLRHNCRSVICWSVVALCSLLIAIGIARLTPRMSPVLEGDSNWFWLAATGIELSPEVEYDWGKCAYIVDEEWAAYDLHGIHGCVIFRAPMRDCVRDFDAVVAALEDEVQRGETRPALTGYVQWRDDPKQPRTVAALLRHIDDAETRYLVKIRPEVVAYDIAHEQLFWQSWQRSDWYWASIVFEWAFLSGLVLFALWPVIRRLAAWRLALNVALLPMLFFLPCYLGYASFATSSSGPYGGILYPSLLRYCRFGWMSDFDLWVLRRLPQVLEPLGEPNYFMIYIAPELSRWGAPGPTFAIASGLVVGGAVMAIDWVWRYAAPNRLTRQTGKKP